MADEMKLLRLILAEVTRIVAAEAPAREAWTVGDPAGRRTGEVMARYVFTTHKNKMVRSDDGDDGGTKADATGIHWVTTPSGERVQ